MHCQHSGIMLFSIHRDGNEGLKTLFSARKGQKSMQLYALLSFPGRQLTVTSVSIVTVLITEVPKCYLADLTELCPLISFPDIET